MSCSEEVEEVSDVRVGGLVDRERERWEEKKMEELAKLAKVERRSEEAKKTLRSVFKDYTVPQMEYEATEGRLFAGSEAKISKEGMGMSQMGGTCKQTSVKTRTKKIPWKGIERRNWELPGAILKKRQIPC